MTAPNTSTNVWLIFSRNTLCLSLVLFASLMQNIPSSSLVHSREETHRSNDEIKVFVLDIPAELNHALILRAIEYHTNGSLSNPGSSIRNIVNYGLGENLQRPRDSTRIQKQNWFDTHQFNLEMILHHRLLSHRFRTMDPLEADILWIPYYPAFGAFFAVDPNKDRALQVQAHERALLAWLSEHAPNYNTERWRYVMALGCVSHQFMVHPDENWGSNLLASHELHGVNIVGIESIPGCSEVCWGDNVGACTQRCHGRNGRLPVNPPLVGIPYPSFYHALRANELATGGHREDPSWKKEGERTILATFVGEAKHGEILMPLRALLIENCRSKPDLCVIASANKQRGKLDLIIQMYRESVFCLQPAGDTATRKGIFDAIMCGCIPVVFSPDQLGGVEDHPLQYKYHLPKPYETSILVPEINQSDTLGYLASIALDKDRLQAYQTALARVAFRLQYSHPKDRCQEHHHRNEERPDGELCESDALDVLLESLAQEIRRKQQSVSISAVRTEDLERTETPFQHK